MKQTGRWNRALAWLCVVVMIVMMLPMSGFTTSETEEEQPIISEAYVPEEIVDEMPTEGALAEEQTKPEAPAEEAAAEGEEQTKEEPMLMLDGAAPEEGKCAFELSEALQNAGYTIAPTSLTVADGGTVTITAPTHFSCPDSITVTDGEDQSVVNTYTSDNGEIVFAASVLPDQGTVTIDGDAKEDANVKVTFTGTNVSWNKAENEKHYTDVDFSATLTADENYTIDETKLAVKVGDSDLEKDDTGITGYTYSSGVIGIAKTLLTGNVEITATATKNFYYDVSAENGSSSFTFKIAELYSQVYFGENVEIQLTAGDYCDLPAAVDVKVGDSKLGASDYEYSAESGIVKINTLPGGVAGGKGTIVISGTATATKYTVKASYKTADIKEIAVYVGSDVLSAGSEIGDTQYKKTVNDNGTTDIEYQMTHWDSTKITLNAQLGKSMSATSAPEVSGVAEDDYKYSIKTGNKKATFTVASEKVKDSFSVGFGTEAAAYKVTIDDSSNVVLNDANDREISVVADVEAKITLAADSGYTLDITAEELSLYCSKENDHNGYDSEVELTHGTAYTYDSAQHILTVFKDSVLGKLRIEADATLNPGQYKISGKNSDGWYSEKAEIKPNEPAKSVSLNGKDFYTEIVIGGTEAKVDGTVKYLPDGEYTDLTVYVCDKEDGTGKISTPQNETIKVDTTAPVVTVGNPENGTGVYDSKYYTNDKIEVTFTVEDTNFAPAKGGESYTTQEDNYTITVKPLEGEPSATVKAVDWEYNATDEIWEGTVTLSAAESDDGEYTVELHVKDIAGNSNESTSDNPTNISKTIVLDTTAPVVTVGDPVAKAKLDGKYYTNETANVTFTVEDTNFVPSVTSGYRDTAKDNFTITCAADYTFTWTDNKTCEVTLTSTGTNDGEYTVELDVTDIAGNANESTSDNPTNISKTIVLDKTAPVVTVENPENGTGEYNSKYYTNNEIAVTFKVKDTNFNPEDEGAYTITTEASYTEGKWTQNSNVWTMTVTLLCEGNNDCEGNDDGEYTVKLDVADRATNTKEATSATLVLDTNAPTISVTYYQTENIESWLDIIRWKIFGKGNAENGNITGYITITDDTSPIDVSSISVQGLPSYNIPEQTTSKIVVVEFTVSSDYKDQITVSVKDMATNNGSLTANNEKDPENEFGTNYILDKTAPTISFNSPDYSSVHSSDYALSLTITDPAQDDVYSGLYTVDYQMCEYNTLEDAKAENKNYSVLTNVLTKNSLYSKGEKADYTQVLTTEIKIDASYNSNLIFVIVTAVDNAGNIYTARTDCFKMDEAEPVVSVEYDNDDVKNSKYFNADRVATVTVVDDNFSADKVDIFTEGVVGKWSAGSDKIGEDGIKDTYTCQISYKEDNDYTLSMTVEDLGGNVTEDGDVAYSGAAPQEFTLDKTAPVIEAGVPEGISHEGAYEGVYYTNDTAKVTFTVTDRNFDPTNVHATTITKDGAVAETAKFTKSKWSQNGDVWTMTVTLLCADNADGQYTVTLEATDLATNKDDDTSEKIVLDKTSPDISDVTYKQTENLESWLKKIFWKIFGQEETENGSITGSITVTDETSPIDVSSISVQGLPSAVVPVQTTSKSVTITFAVPEDYQGQIQVVAQDMATNEDSLVFNSDNTRDTNYILDKVAPVVTFNNPDYETVHSSDYTLSLNVTDPKENDVFSGLNSVQYEICKYTTKANADSQGSFTVLDKGTLYSKSAAEYDQSLDSSVVISAGYNSNLVFVRVIATDNAGNECVDSRTDCFKMDNAAPSITVAYDNNNALNSKYFMANRIATITVVDDNFSDDLISITTDGSQSTWSAGTDRQKNDGVLDTYTCQISYTTDNDYQLSMTAADLGGNSTEDSAVNYTGTATQDFTLDKTNPIYTVEFRGNSETIKNDGYSQSDTTVLLSVNEHNFDASSATSGLTVTKDGVDISADIRNALSWISNGDTRVASFMLVEDGDYVVTMSFIDMAGNNSTDAGTFQVHVDQNDPVVKITGVQNKSANNGAKIAPIVTISDKYYDETSVIITLTNGKGETVESYNGSTNKLTGSWLVKSGVGDVIRDDEQDTSSQVFTFENIDTDDVYSLVVTMTDLSGRTNSVMTVLNDKNEEEELSLEKNGKMQFSVNRNGSTYTVDDDTLAALNQYVQSIDDVHIMEINVDELDPESIHLTLTHDNNSRDLEYGKDYTYQQPPEQNESGWNVYEYILDKSLFEEDGVYTVTVYSVDAAGNISQNNTAEKDFEITFIVDKTAPIFVAMNLEAGEIYNEESRIVTLNCSDNIALDTVHVYMLDSTAEKDADGNYIWYETDAVGNVNWLAKELTVTQDGDNYSFELKEGTSAATSKQSVLVVCTDKAGNQNEEQEILDFTVSSNVWIRYYANKPLFYGSIGGVVALLIVAGFVIFRNKEEVSKKKSASHLH